MKIVTHLVVAELLICASLTALPAQILPPRVAQEADVLERNAARILTRESLQQRALMPPSRFRPRAGSDAQRATGPRLRIREVVSEFSFGTLQSSLSHDLIEFRQVLSVDGQPLQTADNAVRVLSQTIRQGDDRTRKRMLEEFARNGLVNIATDYALIILAFTSRGQQQMEFSAAGQGYIGTDPAIALAWKQKSTQGGILEFHGRDSVRRALQGTLWVRASDGLPLRINAGTEYTDQASQAIRDDATIDYVMSEHGFLTPASVIHRHVVNGAVMAENLYRYEPFQLFSSSSTITFGSPDPASIKK